MSSNAFPYPGPITIGVLESEDGKTKIRFQYNPSQVTDTKAIQYGAQTSKKDKAEASPYGSYEPLCRFQYGGARTISLNLLFDAFHPIYDVNGFGDGTSFKEDDLEKILNDFRNLAYPKEKNFTGGQVIPKKVKKFTGPPKVKLALGNSLVVPGYITSLSITIKQFNENLKPVKAEVSFTIQEYYGLNQS
ncbi:MAG: hypothetical protein D6805_02460 [Planctomycetota bacterium]|nr:MAG: hypothetical protein D6805_02460 [Planctomycetota bacterium]